MKFCLEVWERYNGFHRHVSHDKSAILAKGAFIHLEGTSSRLERLVVRHDDKRKLLLIKEPGSTNYISRGTGSVYSPARFILYEYLEQIVGNEIHLWVDLFGIMKFNVNWKPGQDG